MSDSTPKQIFSIKRLETQGIQTFDKCDASEVMDKYYRVQEYTPTGEPYLFPTVLRMGRDAFPTLELAKAAARVVLGRKIRNLRKKIVKLERMLHEYED